MYHRQRKYHKPNLIFGRLIIVFALIAGGAWYLLEDNQRPNFYVEVPKIGRTIGTVLGTQIRQVSDLALQRFRGAGEWREDLKTQKSKIKTGPEISFKLGILSDSHEDTQYFPKILKQLTESQIDFVVHLGDLTNAGELDKMEEAKNLLDQTGVFYFAIPGDHDYNWSPTHNLENFEKIFKALQLLEFGAQDASLDIGSWSQDEGFYFQLKYKDATLIFLDASDNQKGLSSKQFEWLEKILAEPTHLESKMPTFILTHAPPFSPYFPDKEVVRGQDLLKILSGFKVDQVFAGNTHSFARYPDPTSGIEITIVGAAGSYKNPLPQWTEVVVYNDGSFEIEPRPLVEITISR